MAAEGGSSQEDAELQRALALSLLEAQQAQQGAQQAQQGPQRGEPEFSFVDLRSPTAAAATTTTPAAAAAAAVPLVQPGRPSERRTSGGGGSGWPEPELLQVSPLTEDARPCVVDLFAGVAAGEAGGETAGCSSPSWLAGAGNGGGGGRCGGAAEEAGPQPEQQPEQQQQLMARPVVSAARGLGVGLARLGAAGSWAVDVACTAAFRNTPTKSCLLLQTVVNTLFGPAHRRAL